MKESVAVGLVLTVLLFAMSWLHAGQGTEGGAVSLRAVSEDTAPAAETVPAQEETVTIGLHDDQIPLRVLVGDTVRTMTMAEYLPCVVQGEMLPAFAPAALAAQAVAERTYVCYQLKNGGKARHPQADVCADPGCCSAFLSQADARARWGDDYPALEEKIQAAVRETDGVIALYDGVPIMAVFHSSSGGATARCADVWTADLPYLVSVESPESADTVPNYYSVNTFSRSEFRSIFTAAHPEADFGKPYIADLKENGSGRVESVTVGGVTVSGGEMRRLYGLRSAAFTVEVGAEDVVFRVTGYGHGVGMSQYGADALAREGRTWQEIIRWYYTGVTLGGWNG